MRKTVPAREITMCDVCHRESGYLVKCLSCGGEYCLVCEAVIPGCIHNVQVCRNCGDNESVIEIVRKHAGSIRAAIQARDDEIAALPVKRQTVCTCGMGDATMPELHLQLCRIRDGR